MTSHPRPRPYLRVLKWPLLLLVVSLLLRLLLPAAAIETAYSRGIFVGLRTVIDHTLGFVPFPVFYLFWLGILGLVILWIGRARRYGWRVLLRDLLVFLALFVTAFLWLWGFNYGRQPVEEKLGFAGYQPPVEELREWVHTEAEALATLRSSFMKDTLAVTAANLPDDLESAVRPHLRAALLVHGYPAPGRPRGRQLLPKGILLHLSTAGVYWPWVAEGNVDAGLHPLQKPSVLAHEMSHAYGFGDEGTCSFWAWLAGERATEPALEYAFRLDYWRRLASRLRGADPEEYFAWRAERLDPGIRNDLAAIYANGRKYQDIAPVIRDAAYSTYLKAQGIHEGLLNYGRVVQMVEGYRRNFTDGE